MKRRIGAITLALCLVVLGGAVWAKSASRTLVETFIRACEAGDAKKALALCVYEVGNGKERVPAEPQVKAFIGYIKSRTLVFEGEYPVADSGGIIQEKYLVKEDGSFAIFNTKPFKGGKRLITAINMGKRLTD